MNTKLRVEPEGRTDWIAFIDPIVGKLGHFSNRHPVAIELLAGRQILSARSNYVHRDSTVSARIVTGDPGDVYERPAWEIRDEWIAQRIASLEAFGSDPALAGQRIAFAAMNMSTRGLCAHLARLLGAENVEQRNPALTMLVVGDHCLPRVTEAPWRGMTFSINLTHGLEAHTEALNARELTVQTVGETDFLRRFGGFTG